LLAGRLDDPGRHQLLKDRVLAAGLIEPELAIHRSDGIQQPPIRDETISNAIGSWVAATSNGS
jgi:hypothetical protein